MDAYKQEITLELVRSWRNAYWDGPFQEAKNQLCDFVAASLQSRAAQQDSTALLAELVDDALVGNAEYARKLIRENPRVTCCIPVEWVDRARRNLSCTIDQKEPTP